MQSKALTDVYSTDVFMASQERDENALEADLNVWQYESSEESVKQQIASLKSSFHEINKTLYNLNKHLKDSDQQNDKEAGDRIAEAIRNNSLVAKNDYVCYTEFCLYPELRNDRDELEDSARDINQMTGAAIRSLFRQRNLLILQLQTQEKQLEKQETLINEQIAAIEKKKDLYAQQVKNYYKEYKNKFDEFELMKRQIPINFLTNDSIIKGYNEAGDLVAIYDNYDIIFVLSHNFMDTLKTNKMDECLYIF